MATNLLKISTHVPPGVLQRPEVRSFIAVLEGMQSVRMDEIDTYIRSFMPEFVTDMEVLKLYLDEWGCEYTSKHWRRAIYELYFNHYFYLSKKGTEDGLIKLLQSHYQRDDDVPVVTIDLFQLGKPLILSSDKVFYDWLPGEDEIGDEVADVAVPEPYNDTRWTRTLLGNDWTEHKTRLDITVATNYGGETADFNNFIKSIIPKYVYMTNDDFLILNLTVT